MTAQSLLVLLLILMATVIELREAYKPRRASEFQRTKSWHRPRWRSVSSYARYHRARATPPKGHYRRAPVYHRYAASYRESMSDDPYTIVIQLPERLKHGGGRYERYRDRHNDYASEDYDDDYDDLEARAFRAGEKDVRVKVTKGTRPKVHIKISRNDNGSAIVERSNVTGMQVSLRPDVFMNYRPANSRTVQQTLLPPPPPPAPRPAPGPPNHQSYFPGI